MGVALSLNTEGIAHSPNLAANNKNMTVANFASLNKQIKCIEWNTNTLWYHTQIKCIANRQT
jgi:hypothetical protein